MCAAQTKIRHFKSDDRDRVRGIAAFTARGCELTPPRLLADLLTDYYVTYEPQHLLVAQTGKEISGYLSGCVNTRRCRRIKAVRVFPAAVLKALLRGQIGVAEIKYAVFFLGLAVRVRRSGKWPAGYPAHFHINVKAKNRGAGVGSELVNKFLTMLREAEVEGVHVRVKQNDKNARSFFKKFGFSRQYGYPTLIATEEGIITSRTVIYTKKL